MFGFNLSISDETKLYIVHSAIIFAVIEEIGHACLILDENYMVHADTSLATYELRQENSASVFLVQV